MYFNFAVNIPIEKGKIITKKKVIRHMFSTSMDRFTSQIKSMLYHREPLSER